MSEPGPTAAAPPDRASWPAQPLRLEPVAEAAGEARRYVRRVLTESGHDQLVASAELGVSELVTNACLHARTPCLVRIGPGQAGPVRITVIDDSPVVPRQRSPGAFSIVGRGLRLLAAAGAWGVEVCGKRGPGKAVWFEPAGDWDETAFLGLLSGEARSADHDK